MSAAELQLEVPGYVLLRILSERDRSRVYLAQGPDGLCALKLQQPARPELLPEIAARFSKLQTLSRGEGLVHILAQGSTPQGWHWEALPLADGVPGLPTVANEQGKDHYMPLTLRALIIERGPASSSQVIGWGMRLSRALGILHVAGWVHRDVKPANILFFGGNPHLADYGLVGKPGGSIDFSGTEGFQPLEGNQDQATDLFALGKTLYEAWTAADRLEFPSLPRAVHSSPDWEKYGRHLNELLLRACHPQPCKRFHSAEEFTRALESAQQGVYSGTTRRRWFVAVSGIAVAAVTGTLWILKTRTYCRWTRVHGKFNVEDWQGHLGTMDWGSRKLYSVANTKNHLTFYSLDLDDFQLDGPTALDLQEELVTSILHPVTKWLWAIIGGHGEVVAIDPTSKKTKSLGGGPVTRRHFKSQAYWNPITCRVGVFGGYGQFAVRNDRDEFDQNTGRWIEVESNRIGQDPWPREPAFPLVANPGGTRLFLVGGRGNSSGKQGDRVPSLRWFDGQFHFLDDIWELDLTQSTWRRLLPLGQLAPQKLRAAIYHPIVRGLLLFEGLEPSDKQTQPRTLLFRPGVDTRPLELVSQGSQSALRQIGGCVLDPRNQEVILLSSDGIFRVAVVT
jgi:serine/threonine protein kinase